MGVLASSQCQWRQHTADELRPAWWSRAKVRHKTGEDVFVQGWKWCSTSNAHRRNVLLRPLMQTGGSHHKYLQTNKTISTVWFVNGALRRSTLATDRRQCSQPAASCECFTVWASMTRFHAGRFWMCQFSRACSPPPFALDGGALKLMSLPSVRPRLQENNSRGRVYQWRPFHPQQEVAIGISGRWWKSWSA